MWIVVHMMQSDVPKTKASALHSASRTMASGKATSCPAPTRARRCNALTVAFAFGIFCLLRSNYLFLFLNFSLHMSKMKLLNLKVRCTNFGRHML